MDKLDLKTRIHLVQLYYQNGWSASAALRRFKTENKLIHDPFSVKTVQRLKNKFEENGVVVDLSRSGRPSPSDDFVQTVQQTLTEVQTTAHLHALFLAEVEYQSLQL